MSILKNLSEIANSSTTGPVVDVNTRWNGEIIKWRILSYGHYRTPINTPLVLLIPEKPVKKMQWGANYHIYYKDSFIHKFLIGEFYNSFSNLLKSNLVSVEIQCGSYLVNGKEVQETLNTPIFIPSAVETGVEVDPEEPESYYGDHGTAIRRFDPYNPDGFIGKFLKSESETWTRSTNIYDTNTPTYLEPWIIHKHMDGPFQIINLTTRYYDRDLDVWPIIVLRPETKIASQYVDELGGYAYVIKSDDHLPAYTKLNGSVKRLAEGYTKLNGKITRISGGYTKKDGILRRIF